MRLVSKSGLPAAAVRNAAAVLLSGVAACIAPAATAQDNDGQFWAEWLSRKDQIVVSATLTPVKIEDLPVTVSIKTAEQIADEMVTDIKELVRFEPGISVQRQPARFNAAASATGRAGNEGFNIRGIGGNRVLIQVDGVRVPDGFSFGAQSAGRGDYVDLGLLKSVEIMRGPSSALYGSDGLAGAISFTTSDPADFLEGGKSVGGLVRAAFASADNEFEETAIVAGRSGNWSAMAAYTRRDWNEMDNQGTVGGTGATRTAPNPQDGRSNAVLARLVYEPAGGHKVRLTGEYLDTHLFTQGLTGLSPTVELLEGIDTGNRKRVTLDWSWQGDGPISFARAAVFWQDALDRQFTDENRTPLADRERLNTFENRVLGVAADARANFTTGALAHELVFGADVNTTRQQGLRDGTVPPVGETFPTRAFPTTDFIRAGAFMGDQITLGGLTLYPALRFDWYKLSPKADPLLPGFAAAGQSASRVSPKLGAVWKLTDGVRLFANYANGFKAPEPGQINQFFQNPAQGYISSPNPDLGPERSESFEGGVRLSGNGVSLDITAFSSRYRDFISQEVVGGAFTPANPAVFQFVNLDRVNVHGAEARFEARAKSGLHANLALSYAHGDVIAPGDLRAPLSTVDPLKLVMGLGFRDPQGRFGGQIIATHSARKEDGRTTGLCTPACFRPAGFTIVDLVANARLFEGMTLRAGVFNLLDEKYAWWSDVRGLASTSTITDAFTQPGRNASVSLAYRF
ncbi:TonB-dependent hemoglobin/transferrin/lactoferrin family receptor [Novosphingobium sp.]|uniref:TonB-dependent hemoglobin/transferrin/lactoferrin family receptor n=1 Tax=Novosphingobium sp. TaxID=1874826 RepID=UPI0035681D84